MPGFGRNSGVRGVGAPARLVARGLPFGGQGLEAAGEFFELADGRAQSRREHGVLGRVFGDEGDQEVDDRRQGLAQGNGGCGMHS